MKTNLKVALSAIAFAALAAAPAVAKSHAQERANTQPPAYVNDQVVLDGKVIGADPDATFASSCGATASGIATESLRPSRYSLSCLKPSSGSRRSLGCLRPLA
jgi:hypothetical protein